MEHVVGGMEHGVARFAACRCIACGEPFGNLRIFVGMRGVECAHSGKQVLGCASVEHLGARYGASAYAEVHVPSAEYIQVSVAHKP